MLTETCMFDAEIDRSGLLACIRRHDPDRYLQAMVAGCAVVACADGRAAAADRASVLSLVRNDPLLSLYPGDLAESLFDGHVRAFAEDQPAAFVHAIRLIVACAGCPAQARAVLRACLIIAGARDDVGARTIDAVRAVREALNLGSGPAPRIAEDSEAPADRAAAAARLTAADAGTMPPPAFASIPDRFLAAMQSAHRLRATGAGAARVHRLVRPRVGGGHPAPLR